MLLPNALGKPDTALAAKRPYVHDQEDFERLDPDEELRFLQQELLRTELAKIITESFVAAAEKQKIPIYREWGTLGVFEFWFNSGYSTCSFVLPVAQLRFPATCLLTNTETGEAFIADELLSSMDVVKFSGTVQAGLHGKDDLAGQTCDTLAHWSYITSDKTLVFTDIQGTCSQISDK